MSLPKILIVEGTRGPGKSWLRDAFIELECKMKALPPTGESYKYPLRMPMRDLQPLWQPAHRFVYYDELAKIPDFLWRPRITRRWRGRVFVYRR